MSKTKYYTKTDLSELLGVTRQIVIERLRNIPPEGRVSKNQRWYNGWSLETAKNAIETPQRGILIDKETFEEMDYFSTIAPAQQLRIATLLMLLRDAYTESAFKDVIQTAFEDDPSFLVTVDLLKSTNVIDSAESTEESTVTE